MLYIVATPIGNSEDLSYRAAKTLAESDIILTEDTRSSGFLLRRITELFKFKINPAQKLISYYKEKEFEKLPEILDILKEDQMVSIVSESGMPLISDPGYVLLTQVIKQSIPYTVIPGPSAVTTAIPLSGLIKDNFLYLGFIPKKESEIKKLCNKLVDISKILPECGFVLYESPHRIQKTLSSFNEYIPRARIALCREMTKKFEEVVRGTPKDLMGGTYKGEIVLVVTLED